MSAVNSKENHMESLAEIFRCFICMEKLQDAHMCPHCSKLCCYPCIHRWLTQTKSQCPHCRSSLYIQDVVNCRWAEEVTHQLDSLQDNLPGKKQRCLFPRECVREAEKCISHPREELSVYCNSCKCCICHECALWSSTHKGHCFKPLDDVYNFHSQEIKEQSIRLRRSFAELITYIHDVDKNVDFIRAAKDQQVRDMRNSVELMIARLDRHLEMKLTTLVNQKTHLVRKSEDIETLLREIDHQLSSGPKSGLIEESSKLLKSMQDSITKASFSVSPVVADFQNELVPNYESSSFVVDNFSLARSKADAFYSEPLVTDGLSWRLKVYPDGNGGVRGTYMSVFLELTKGPTEPAKYEYRIEMVNQAASDNTRNMVREFSSDFEVGECWGYNRFFRLDLLESEGYLNTVTDSIKLRFEVRPPSYCQKSRAQQWYLSQLISVNAQQAAQIEELKNRQQLSQQAENITAQSSEESKSPNNGKSTVKTRHITAARTQQRIYEPQNLGRRLLSPKFQVNCGEIELEVGNENNDDSDNESDTSSINVKLLSPLEENDLDQEVIQMMAVPSSYRRQIAELELSNLGFTENDSPQPLISSSSNYFNLLDELQFVALPEELSNSFTEEQITEFNPFNTVDRVDTQNNSPEADISPPPADETQSSTASQNETTQPNNGIQE